MQSGAFSPTRAAACGPASSMQLLQSAPQSACHRCRSAELLVDIDAALLQQPLTRRRGEVEGPARRVDLQRAQAPSVKVPHDIGAEQWHRRKRLVNAASELEDV